MRQGKRAAISIDRFISGEFLEQPAERKIPKIYVEPVMLSDDEMAKADRAVSPSIPVAVRHSSFDEVEMTISEKDAMREAQRCLRCDLEFTKPKEEHIHIHVREEQTV